MSSGYIVLKGHEDGVIIYSNNLKKAEAKEAHLQNKVDAAAPQVSVAT